MKIMLLGTAWPYRGGLASYNERLIHEFIAEGYDAEIITFTTQYPAFLFPGKTQYSTSQKPADIHITRLLNSVNPFNWYRVGRFVRKKSPDILLIKYWMPFMAPSFGTVARIVKRNKNTKVIAILDNIIPHEKRFYDKPFTNYFTKIIDGYVVMSNEVMSDLVSVDKLKPSILTPHPIFDNFGNGVDKTLACENLGLDPSVHYLLFFGFIREYKGLDLLLKAFSAHDLKKYNLKLIIAGEYYTSKDKYLNLIAQYDLADRVYNFDRFIPDEEVKYFFCASDLLILPYRHATQSGVAQIAMHFDRPVIVTDVGSLSETVINGETGYVIKPNPQEIAKAIIKFYEGEATATFSKQIQRYKKKYSWGALVNSILYIYEKITHS